MAYPASLDALTNPQSTDLLTNPSHSGQHTDINNAVEAIEASVGLTGTSFPGSPTTGDRFYRTDLHLGFFYDGTRWLSQTLYESPIHLEPATWPFSVTTAAALRAHVPGLSATIYVEKFFLGFYVTGGTALGASHKWVVELRVHPSATTIGTVNIASGASDAYREDSATVNSVVASTEVTIRVDATKTGTPGTLLAWPRFSYRLIGT